MSSITAERRAQDRLGGLRILCHRLDGCRFSGAADDVEGLPEIFELLPCLRDRFAPAGELTLHGLEDAPLHRDERLNLARGTWAIRDRAAALERETHGHRPADGGDEKPGQSLGFRAVIPGASGVLGGAPPQFFGLCASTAIVPRVREHVERDRQAR